MKYSQSEIVSRVYKIPELKFEEKTLTSSAGQSSMFDKSWLERVTNILEREFCVKDFLNNI